MTDEFNEDDKPKETPPPEPESPMEPSDFQSNSAGGTGADEKADTSADKGDKTDPNESPPWGGPADSDVPDGKKKPPDDDKDEGEHKAKAEKDDPPEGDEGKKKPPDDDKDEGEHKAKSEEDDSPEDDEGKKELGDNASIEPADFGKEPPEGQEPASDAAPSVDNVARKESEELTDTYFPNATPEEREQRVQEGMETTRPIAEANAKQGEVVDHLPQGGDLKNDVYDPALRGMDDDQIRALANARQDPEGAGPALEELKSSLAGQYELSNPTYADFDANLDDGTAGTQREVHGPAQEVSESPGADLPTEQHPEGPGHTLHDWHDVKIDPEQADPVMSLGHEMRHAAQDEMSEKMYDDPGDRAAYLSDKEYGDDRYREQPYEQDARQAGEQLRVAVMAEAHRRGLYDEDELMGML